MIDAHATRADLESLALPSPVRDACHRIGRAGFAAWLVGPALRALRSGQRPDVFEILSDATSETLIDLFPHAVPVDPARSTLSLPTSAGPIDLHASAGEDIESVLARSDFTFHAIAFDPRNDRSLDPHGGWEDAAAARIRTVGPAATALRADPMRALRAVRIASCEGLKLDPELDAALDVAAPLLARVAPIRIRAELTAILLSPGASTGLETLERCRLTATLTSGASAGRFAWMDHLPFDLELRLAAWIGEGRLRRSLHRLRYPNPLVARCERLVRYHPIDANVEPEKLSAVARFARRVGRRDSDALLALRRAEMRVSGAADPPDLARIESALDTVRSQSDAAERREGLALSGADVMRILECDPGPRIGQALAYLAQAVGEDPGVNRPETLQRLLLAWNEQA